MCTTNDEIERNRNTALLITNLTKEIRELTIDRDAWRLTAKTLERANSIISSAQRETE